MATRFTLRKLFSIVTVVAVLLGGCTGLYRYGNTIIRDVERDYWRQRVEEGSRTRDEARRAVGDIVDTWPKSPNEKSN